MTGTLVAFIVSFAFGMLLRVTREAWDPIGVCLFFLFFFCGGLFALAELGGDGQYVLIAIVGQLSALIFLSIAFLPGRASLLTLTTRQFCWGVGGGLLALVVSNVWLLLLALGGVEHEEQALIKELEAPDGIYWVLLLAVVVAPIVEELLFRGGLLEVLLRGRGAQSAILLSALLFGFVHIDSLTSVPPLIFFGAILAWLRLEHESLMVPIVAHITNNGIVMMGSLWLT